MNIDIPLQAQTTKSLTHNPQDQNDILSQFQCHKLKHNNVYLYGSEWHMSNGWTTRVSQVITEQTAQSYDDDN